MIFKYNFKLTRKLFYLLVSLFSATLFAQTASDSLAVFSKAKNKDVAWVDKMIVKVDKISNSEPKLAFEYSNMVLDASNKLGYAKGIQNSMIQSAQILNVLGKYEDAKTRIESALKRISGNDFDHEIKALITLGIVNFNMGLYDPALVAYDKAEKIIGKDAENLQNADIYNNRANVYSLRGNYNLAIEDYLRAEEIYKMTNQNSLLAVVYNNLGTENRNLHFYKKSIEYYQLASEINETYKDLFNLAKNYSNIGVSYNALDSIDKALKYYKKSLVISEGLGSNLVLAQNYVNIANIYEKKADYKIALEFFNKSLEICKKEKITYGLVLNYMNIGNTNFLMKNYESAIVNLDSSLKYAKVLGLPKEESQIYERFTRVYKGKGDFKNAFYFQSLFKEINDSLVTTEKHKQIVELQEKYDKAQNQKTILELKDKQISQKLTIGYLIVLALLLAIFVGWFLYKRNLSLKEKKIAEVTADKMQLQIELKNNELTQKALNIVHLQENNKHIISDIEEILKESKVPAISINQLVRKIKISSENSNIWDEFDLRFKEIHGNFYSKIISGYPALSPVELRIVALLHLNLTTKEIAEIMQRSIKTIENTRGIIRKKMNLEKGANLTSFILSIK